MKVIKLHKKPKTEDKYIYPFLAFYCKSKKTDVRYKAILEQSEHKTPDYHVTTIDSLVEVKEVHDTKDRSRSAQWGKIVNNLRKQIRNNKKLKKINGLYSIATPSVFKFPTDKKKIKDASDKILQAIIDNKTDISLHNVTFKLEKVNNKDNGVYFSAMGLGGSFDPARTIDENIKDKLATANKQLDFKLDKQKFKKKIVLLINHYHLLHWDWDLYKAVSYSYKQLLTYKNIDEIWFQSPNKDGTFSHKLLYTKQFLSGYHNQKLKVDKENSFLLSNWFSALEKLGDEYKKKLFIALKSFLNTKKPCDWFEESVGAREEMVRLGIWLIENKRFDDVVWLIKKFINDPNPEEPEDYSGDPKFNYHQQIADGEDPHIITTVLGHLAWVVQKLATQRKEENKKYTLKAFSYTKQLLEHRNLYVELQAIIPLVEITRRRQWIEGYGRRESGKRVGEYKEFHETVFNLVRLIQQSPSYVALAKWLTHVFAYYKDLSTEEAKQVLDALKVTSESAGLFIYFGIFRQRHYRDQPIEFDGERLENRLKRIIKNKAKKCTNLRGSIIWHFWKLLDENPEEFNTIKPYIDLFLEQPYQRAIYDNLLRIIEDWIEREPDVCINWFCLMLNKISEFVNSREKGREFWLTTKTGKILNVIAQEQPEELRGIVEKLVKLWKLGAFIGSPKEIFEAYGQISNVRLKMITKKKFQFWYKSMKKLNPKLEKVDWK